MNEISKGKHASHRGKRPVKVAREGGHRGVSEGQMYAPARSFERHKEKQEYN